MKSLDGRLFFVKKHKKKKDNRGKNGLKEEKGNEKR